MITLSTMLNNCSTYFTTVHCSIDVVFIIQVLSYFLKCCVLILLVCSCLVYHCVICVYGIRSLDCNFPINTYFTYLTTSTHSMWSIHCYTSLLHNLVIIITRISQHLICFSQSHWRHWTQSMTRQLIFCRSWKAELVRPPARSESASFSSSGFAWRYK